MYFKNTAQSAGPAWERTEAVEGRVVGDEETACEDAQQNEKWS